MSQAIAAGTTTGNALRVKIAGMDCGSCAMTIENSMRQLPGVTTVTVSFTTETMEIGGNAALPPIEQGLKELGYRRAGNPPEGGAGQKDANPIPVKWALGRMGRIGEAIRLPLTPLAPAYHETVVAALREAGCLT